MTCEHDPGDLALVVAVALGAALTRDWAPRIVRLAVYDAAFRLSPEDARRCIEHLRENNIKMDIPKDIS